jgi:hypothetical protein
MSEKDVLAIDFGTTNTYYCKCPADQLSPKGVDFGDGRDGLATAILYREGKPPVVGQSALQEYVDATERERSGYQLRTQFKPDIATGQNARRYATDFLRQVLSDARSQHLDIDPMTRQVIFGVPSEAKGEFREALKDIAREAGYGDITMTDEPKGALVYVVHNRDVPATDAMRGLLVIDFGGGTCDFAFLRRGEVKHSWGSMSLGGRLFDDLFFQWFIEDNPGALEALRKDGAEGYVQSWVCREIKENFSRTMARDRSEKVSQNVRTGRHTYGRITNMTWEAFLRKAEVYSPSETLKRFLSDTGGCLSIADDQNGPVDLFAWFRNCLIEGIQNVHIDKSDVRFVILAGGSSLWPFVAEIVQEELGVKPEQIKRSDRPYATISTGLALLPALRARNLATKSKLRQELPAFFDNLKSLLDRRFRDTAKEIAAAVTQELFDEKIKPILLDFRAEGGSINSLRSRISDEAASFEPRLINIIRDKVSVLEKGIPGNVKEMIEEWFNTHNLLYAEDDMQVAVGKEGVGKPNIPVDVHDGIIDSIAAVTGIIVTAIVTMICGGGGMALILSGPIGVIIGLILGVVIAFLIVTYGADKAKQMAEGWNIPGGMLRFVLRDGKISDARTKLSTDLESKVQQLSSDVQAQITKQVSERVDRVIEALGDINQI